jgi:hypothetical protein
VPQKGWFHGIDYEMCKLYRQTLVDLGCSVFDVPIDAFVPPDIVRISTLSRDIRAFRPELAIGDGILRCQMPPEHDGWRPNFFTEVLGLSTICFWDHAPLELANALLTPLPEDPSASRAGAYAYLQRALTHERLLHCSFDTGQTRLMERLGFVSRDRIVQLHAPTLPNFLATKASDEATDANEQMVSFVGHFYKMPVYQDEHLEQLAQNSLHEWSETRTSALWNVLARRVESMPAELRNALALDVDQTFFWDFAQRLIDHRAQTYVRLKFLAGAGVPVACYGNLQTEVPETPANLHQVRSHVDFGPELAAVFARHPITIDVLSPGFIDGYSFKANVGFAAGGFVLVDRKHDFITAFGEAGEAVTYVSTDDLSAKIDRFLTNPRYRREVRKEIQAKVLAKHTLDAFFSNLLNAAHVRHAVGLSRGQNAALRSTAEQSLNVLEDLSLEIRTHAHWRDASVERGADGTIVTTSPQAWAYAAEIPIRWRSQAGRKLCVRLTLVVESGRIGIAALHGASGKLFAEQVVSSTAQPVSLTLEWPQDLDVTVILRNSVNTRSRVVVLEAMLCEHTQHPIRSHRGNG